MALKFREYWFGFFLGAMVFVALLFVVVVMLAPHNDAKMRGFSPCTVRMAADLNAAGAERDLLGTVASVGKGYACYAAVIAEGASLWLKGMQPSFWSNYMFEPEIDIGATLSEESEPFSEDLIRANLLDEEERDIFITNDNVKEN